jgi:hypothetical protein
MVLLCSLCFISLVSDSYIMIGMGMMSFIYFHS